MSPVFASVALLLLLLPGLGCGCYSLFPPRKPPPHTLIVLLSHHHYHPPPHTSLPATHLLLSRHSLTPVTPSSAKPSFPAPYSLLPATPSSPTTPLHPPHRVHSLGTSSLIILATPSEVLTPSTSPAFSHAVSHQALCTLFCDADTLHALTHKCTHKVQIKGRGRRPATEVVIPSSSGWDASHVAYPPR